MSRLLAGQAVERTSVAHEPGTQVVVGAASVELVDANKDRVELIIQNDHATQVVYLRLGPGDAQLNRGIRLNAAGGSYSTDAYTGRVAAIASGASTVVTVTEV